MSDLPLPTEPMQDEAQFLQVSNMVESEFFVEDKLLELGVPTFYIKPGDDSKKAFLRLVGKLDEMKLVPVLRRAGERTVLRVVPKPPVRPYRPVINIILLIATIGTTFFSGYLLSAGIPEAIPNPFIGAVEFTVAILAILGGHEMGHKLAANKYKVEATYPYFIPGIPPIGTFGAVIQQKSLSPNKDSLFDLGASGPVIGFIIAVVVTAVGVLISPFLIPEGNSVSIITPLLFDIFVVAFAKTPPAGQALFLHPVAFAGYVGMIVTTLNLLPTGMLDGGHTVRSLLGDKPRWALTFLSLALLLAFGYWLMFFLVLFFSLIKHPGPLDDVSKLSTKRKVFALVLVVIFVLCLSPLESLF
jgi:membrane-associated protease RseP (regulator of RpoE activity)